MKQKEVKKLGYGVAIHFNEYKQLFEVYKIGTYTPSQPSLNMDSQIVTRGKKLKSAIKKFKKLV